MIVGFFIPVLLGVLFCIVLGANNASVCFGTNVGAGFFKYSVAAGSAAIGVILGSILEGPKLSKAISHGILSEISLEATLVIVITTLIMIAIATILRLPLSLSEGLIGSAIGIGFGSQISVNWDFTFTVLLFWIINPLFAALLAVILYAAIDRITCSVKNILALNYFYGKITLSLSFYVAYVLGANTVGLINGIYYPFMGNRLLVAVTFGTATALGIYFLSRGITESVSKEIIGLSPSTALTAQLSGALTVHLFTQFGLPVSITQALVGAILGIGLAKKVAFINTLKVRKIIAGWLLAPPIGSLISYLIIVLI